MNDCQKIEELLHHFRMRAAEFARKIELNNVQTIYDIQKGKQSLLKTVAPKILEAFPEVSEEWLVLGKGEMLKQSSALKEAEEEMPKGYLVPLLPISAQAGALNDYVVSVKDNECEKVIVPIKGGDLVMPVSGDSMLPEYPNGSQILIKRINEQAFIDWGKVYVLDTCNGSVVKKIFPADSPDKVKCVSTNPEYPPFDVCWEDIYGWYRVLLCMSVK
jgi:phage repressor protein C with HTH and peptisase S24 domain